MPAVKVTKAEITRAIKAWVSCGFEAGGVEIAPDGTIRVLAKTAEPAQSSNIDDWFSKK